MDYRNATRNGVNCEPRKCPELSNKLPPTGTCLLLSRGFSSLSSYYWQFLAIQNFMAPLPNDQETHAFTGGNRPTSSKNIVWASFLNRILVWQMNMTSHTSSHLRSWSFQDDGELNITYIIIFEQILGLLVEVPLLIQWIQQQKY